MSAKNFMLNPLCLSIMLMTGSVATVQATLKSGANSVNGSVRQSGWMMRVAAIPDVIRAARRYISITRPQ